MKLIFAMLLLTITVGGCSNGEPLATVPCCSWFPVNGGEPPPQDPSAAYPVPAVPPVGEPIQLQAQQATPS